MSVHRRSDGAWLVRWREGGRSSRQRQKLVGFGADGRMHAEELDTQLKRKKRLEGVIDLNEGTELFSDYVVEWFQWKRPKMEAKGEQYYRYLIGKYLEPLFGRLELRQLDPLVIENAFDELETDGVSDDLRRRLLTLMQHILSRAVRQRKLQVNPVREIPRPRAKPQGDMVDRVISIDVIEKMRADMLELEREGEALLISLLAYSGLRPQEALALRFKDVGDRTISVQRKLTTDGIKRSTKTGKKRTVWLAYPVLFGEIANWREARGSVSDSEPIFVRESDGKPYTIHDYGNWRSRVYALESKLHGLDSTKPYDLRHTFASLLLSDGHSLVEVAENLGHSPLVCSRTYAHVIKELPDPTERVPAIEQILEVREKRSRRKEN